MNSLYKCIAPLGNIYEYIPCGAVARDGGRQESTARGHVQYGDHGDARPVGKADLKHLQTMLGHGEVAVEGKVEPGVEVVFAHEDRLGEREAGIANGAALVAVPVRLLCPGGRRVD